MQKMARSGIALIRLNPTSAGVVRSEIKTPAGTLKVVTTHLGIDTCDENSDKGRGKTSGSCESTCVRVCLNWGSVADAWTPACR